MKKIDYSNYKKPSDYMKFEQGDNRIRVISSGGMGYQHGLKTAGRWINLGLCTGDKCVHCAKKNEAKRFWRWLVYDFREDDVKMLDAGAMIGNQICEMASQLKDDPQNYDLIVKRSGLGLKTAYTVAKAPDNKPMANTETKSKVRYLIGKYF